MNATTYTGNGGTLTVTNGAAGASFQPDFVWVKNRSGAYDHILGNSVIGVNKNLFSNRTTAEITNNNGGYISAVNSNGFTVITGSSTATDTNTNGDSYVGWQWKAGGTAVSNTSGSITSQVSANTTSGFSVVTYTGNGTSGATIGHGLSAVPSMIIVKSRSAVGGWPVYHITNGATQYINLQTTDAVASSVGLWNNTSPTSSVFSVGNDSWVNTSARTYVAYCWAPIAGYSAFGSYTGNGLADGPFIYTGFRPRFVIIRATNDICHWTIEDSSMNPYNVTNTSLYADASTAQNTTIMNLDFLSNGFKCRNVLANESNVSGYNYIYAAFAENPFKYANAR